MIERKSLTEVTLDLLKHRDKTITVKEIATETGINEHWIWKISSTQRPKHLCSERIQKIYEYLTNEKLDY